MTVDIRLERTGNQPWGFRLIGGSDYEIPLTVIKVQEVSIAESFGLRNGDKLLAINDVLTADLTHDGAYEVIVGAGANLLLNVHRRPLDGLQETGFQPIQITNQDIDHTLHPSEVPDDRSNTASPFLIPTKPYRPFSTEPIEVIPIEDPIILNPNYHDEFPTMDDEDVTKETVFKLPISAQYVDETKKNKKIFTKVLTNGNKEVLSNCSMSEYTTKSEVKQKTCEEVNLFIETKSEITAISNSLEEKMTISEIKYIEEMNKELDITKIEETANCIVEESIEKAVTVSEDIRKEIDIELRDVTSSSTDEMSKSESKISKEISECLYVNNTIRSAVDEINNQSEINMVKTKIDSEKSSKADSVNISQSISENNTEATINNEDVSTSVLSRSSKMDSKNKRTNDINNETEQNVLSSQLEHNHETKKEAKAMQVIETENTVTKQQVSHSSQNRNIVESSSSHESRSSNTSTSKLSAEQRAYTLGLQTLPNIKGRAHSSYHYDLLLKTFFVHLTDVMVALSRFILTDRPLSKSNSEEDVHETASETMRKEVTTKDEIVLEKKKELNIETVSQNNYAETRGDSQKHIQSVEELDITNVDTCDEKKRSGSEMAQLSSKKSDDLIYKMDAVVSELQKDQTESNKCSGLEATSSERSRRSRSRSRIEEEVSKESDPLEWLSKNDESTKSTQIHDEVIKESSATNELQVSECNMSRKQKEISSAYKSEVLEHKDVTSESDVRCNNTKTYIAIVQAHVYTNKESIFDSCSTESSEMITEVTNECSDKQESEHTTKSFQEIGNTDDIETNQDVIEMSLEEVMKKSNIAIITCEPVTDTGNESIVSNLTDSKITVLNEDLSQKLEFNIVEENSNITNNINIIERQQVSNENIDISGAEVSVSNETESLQNMADTSSITERKVNQYDLAEVEQMAMEYKAESILNNSVATINTSILNINTSEIIQESSFTAKCPGAVQIQEEEQQKDITKVITNSIGTLEKEEVVNAIISSEIINVSATHEVSSEIKEVESSSETKEVISSSETKEVVSSSETKVVELSSETKEAESSSETKQVESSSRATEKKVKFKEVVEVSDSYETESTAEKTITAATEIYNSVVTEAAEISTEQSVTANDLEARKLSLKLDGLNKTEYIDTRISDQSDDSTDIKTPTPSTVPPTPLTDEYMFQLKIPVALCPSIPASKEATPEPEEHEDPHIVKKKLIPHIETFIEAIVYDVPLATPVATNVTAPAFIRHGLDTADGNIESSVDSKEELMEIERKSSLLASAIDETIKSIEEYKEQVGMETQTYTNRSLEENNLTLTEKTVSNGDSQEHMQNFLTEINNIETVTGNTEVEIEKQGLEEELKAVTKQAQANFANITKVSEICKMTSARTEEHNEASLQKLQTNVAMNGEGKLTNGFHIDVLQGTTQGIITGTDGDVLIDNELAKEIGKPGMSEDKIAELISGEAEMLREAHVMGLQRVLASHMSRPDDSSVDFQKIKPIIENLKDSEVLKALNDEFTKTQAEKKKDERKWTTFLQKPKRPVPRSKFGYYKFVPEDEEEDLQLPYQVRIVKQPKPKVAPDYIPEEFETGPLPWEERAANEPPPPPVPREDPILIPEELPQYLEAVDQLPESEVPDLEDTGIPLPPEKVEVTVEDNEELPEPVEEISKEETGDAEEVDIEKVVEEAEEVGEEMDQNRIAEDILGSIQNMVDPNASLEQQLQQMRGQLAALAQLPGVIQQTLELVTKQLSSMTIQEQSQSCVKEEIVVESTENTEVAQEETQQVELAAEIVQEVTNVIQECNQEPTVNQTDAQIVSEAIKKIREEEVLLLQEQEKIEKDKKALMQQLESECRQLKHRPTPRVGKPKPAFGPLVPQERPLVLPGGRRWRQPKDAYNDQFIAETLTAQAELIQGKTKGFPYESVYLPYDERSNTGTGYGLGGIESLIVEFIEMPFNDSV